MSARHGALLALGVVAVSGSAILIRVAEAPPLAIAFYRNAFAVAVLLPLALLRHRGELRALSRTQWGAALLAGALLAAHFALWIPSVSLTTVAASTVLVTSQPVWVALAGRAVGERVTRPALAGIALSLGGAVLISGADVGTGPRAALGDLLALLAAVAAAGYFLAGRGLRPRMSLAAYTAVAYTACAGFLAAAMLVAGTPFGGFPLAVWALFALMTLGPQLLGHTVFNYLLRDLPATVVAIAVTGEPVGATVLALALLGELPPWNAVLGGAVILAGIYVTVAAQARRPAVVPIE